MSAPDKNSITRFFSLLLDQNWKKNPYNHNKFILEDDF